MFDAIMTMIIHNAIMMTKCNATKMENCNAIMMMIVCVLCDHNHDEDHYHEEDHHNLCMILSVHLFIVSKSYNFSGSCKLGQGGKEERSPCLLQADIEGLQ